MEYNKKESRYDSVGPGTAGIAQRISTGYRESVESSVKEKSKLFALTFNNVIPCGHNQY